jgi:hypothetical protein
MIFDAARGYASGERSAPSEDGPLIQCAQHEHFKIQFQRGLVTAWSNTHTKLPKCGSTFYITLMVGPIFSVEDMGIFKYASASENI